MKGVIPALPTRVGHAEWGDNQFRGHSVARELVGRESLATLLALAITGRRVDGDAGAILDDVAGVLSVADPRIWLFKLVRVVSSYGSCHAAVAALTLALEDAPIGHHSAGDAAEVLRRVRETLEAEGGADPLADDAALDRQCRRMLETNELPFGFWIPHRERDERVDLLTARVAARGRSELPYWRLFVRVADAYLRIAHVRPNIPIALGAVGLDLGFTPAQIGPLMTALGASAFWANAFEGAEQAPPCLQTLPQECVRYVGPPSRLSPRAAAARHRR